MFRIGGVRLFHGLTDGTDDPDVGPLREITSLCGLTLGAQDRTDQGAVRRDRIRQKPQHVQGVFLATVDGQLVDVGDQPIGRISGAEDFDDQREAGW